MSTLAVFAPAPTIVSAAEAEVRTERVTLEPRRADRGDDEVGAAPATAEGRELRAALAASGRRTSPRRTGDYHAIGLSLAAAPEEPILVRGRVGGVWTPWLEVPFEAGEAPDLDSPEANDGVHSEPLWMGDADAYELDAPATVRRAEVHLVAEGPARRRVVLSPATAGAAGAPSILARSAWGARPPQQHPATTADLKLAIVHHSVNGNTYSSSQVPQLLRSIQAYHQNVQGWNDIAYNFVVDRFGRTWEGRAGGTTNVVVGGHSQGFNTGAVGVVALGDFRNASPPASTVEAIAKVIAWKFAVHRVEPSSRVPFTSAGSAKYPAGVVVTLPRIVGHRDVQATDCPGGLLYGRLGTIRARVAQLVPGYQLGVPAMLLEPDIDGDGLTDPFVSRPGSTADVQWRATATGQFTRTTMDVRTAYRPAVGDFDGDGRDDFLWHGTGSTADHLWWSGPGGPSAQALHVSGSYVPLVGDFDGNGVDDIFWYATGPAADAVWYFEEDRSFVGVSVRQDLITGVPLVGDFDGNGRDDIMFYGPGTADDWLWRSTGRAWKVTSPTVNLWYEPAVFDFDGNGSDDILWVAPGATTATRWTFSAVGNPSGQSFSVPASYGRPRIGDFDGDGRDDALLYAAGSLPDRVWYSTAAGVSARSYTVNQSYLLAAGPMDAPLGAATDDVLFLSLSGPDHLWKGRADRTFSSAQVG